MNASIGFPPCRSEHHRRRYERFITILRARALPEGVLYHDHHVLPRCYEGGNNRENIVTLTIREHYIAHWMLWKAYGGGMAYAFRMMSHVIGVRITSRSYQQVCEEHSSLVSLTVKGLKRSPETIEKIRQRQLNRSLEHKLKLLLYHSQRDGINRNGVYGHSEETRALISLRGQGNKSRAGQLFSEEKREKQREVWRCRLADPSYVHHLLGTTLSEEHKAKIRQEAHKRKETGWTKPSLTEPQLQKLSASMKVVWERPSEAMLEGCRLSARKQAGVARSQAAKDKASTSRYVTESKKRVVRCLNSQLPYPDCLHRPTQRRKSEATKQRMREAKLRNDALKKAALVYL